MLPVVDLHARIVHVRDMTPGQSFIDAEPKRRRLAMVSVRHADGFPRSWHPNATLHAIVDGHRCPVTAPSSLDLLAIDVTDLPDARAAWSGEMAPSPSTKSPRRRDRPAGKCSPLSGAASIASTTPPEDLEPTPMQNKERAMFGKSKEDNDQKPSAAQQAQRTVATKPAEQGSADQVSTISRGMTVVGKIFGEGTLNVFGQVEAWRATSSRKT
jgi:hypothetical protein